MRCSRCKIALQGDDDPLRAFAGGNGAGELGDGAAGIAGGGGIERAVDGELGSIADDGLDVRGIDLGLAGRVQRQLFDLAARHGAVGAHAGDQHLAGIGRDGEAVRLQRFADEALDVARLIGVAGDGGGLCRLLKQHAHGVGGLQVAGLHDQRRRQRAAFEQRLQRSGGDASPGRGAHDFGAAEHRDRLQLDGEAVRIVVEVGVVEADDLAAIARGDEGGELRGALGDKPGVGSIEQHRGNLGPRRVQVRLGLMGLDGNHGARRSEQ